MKLVNVVANNARCMPATLTILVRELFVAARCHLRPEIILIVAIHPLKLVNQGIVGSGRSIVDVRVSHWVCWGEVAVLIHPLEWKLVDLIEKHCLSGCGVVIPRKVDDFVVIPGLCGACGVAS